MKKTTFPIFIAILFCAANLTAQTPSMPDQAAPPPPENGQPASQMGQAARDEFEQKQFAGQVRKLRDGLAKGDFNKVAALQSTLLNAMRREIGQARSRVSAENEAPRPTEKQAAETDKKAEKKVEKNRADEQLEKVLKGDIKADLAKMELILTEMQGFTFKNDNRETSEAKLDLIEQFADILQKNMAESRQKMGAESADGRN